MQVHRRFANPQSWIKYKDSVKQLTINIDGVERDVLDRIG